MNIHYTNFSYKGCSTEFASTNERGNEKHSAVNLSFLKAAYDDNYINVFNMHIVASGVIVTLTVSPLKLWYFLIN